MLRVPEQLLDVDIVRKYCVDDYLSCNTKGQHVIVSFRANEEEPEWTDGEGWLASLIQLRTELMRGDYRCLYRLHVSSPYLYILTRHLYAFAGGSSSTAG